MTLVPFLMMAKSWHLIFDLDLYEGDLINLDLHDEQEMMYIWNYMLINLFGTRST